jgi:hypothetical protein
MNNEIRVALGSFYSKGDEARFFSALNELGAVKVLRGIGGSLQLQIDPEKLDRMTVRELLAVFRRYRLSCKPLIFLAQQEQFAWLRQNGWQKILSDIADEETERERKLVETYGKAVTHITEGAKQRVGR